jgi:hypothetical protein
MSDKKLKRAGFYPENMAAIEECLNRAVQEALLDPKRAGNPICTLRDGKVVWIPPNEIHLDDNANWTHTETP